MGSVDFSNKSFAYDFHDLFQMKVFSPLNGDLHIVGITLFTRLMSHDDTSRLMTV